MRDGTSASANGTVSARSWSTSSRTRATASRPDPRPPDGRRRRRLFVVGDEFQSSTASVTPTWRCSGRRDAAPTVLPLTLSHRSRPGAVGGEQPIAEFGDEFQRLEPADDGGSALRNAFELLVTDKVAAGETGVLAPLRARHVARACASWWTRATRRRVRSCSCSRRHRRRVVRGGAARGRAPHVPRRPARLLRAAAGRRPPRLPAAPPEPLRRRGAADGADLALRRRLQRRARAPPCGGAAAADLPQPRAVAARRPVQDDLRMLLAFRQRYERLLDVAAHEPLELLCERVIVEHDYDLAVLHVKTGTAATPISASSPGARSTRGTARRRSRGVRRVRRGAGGARREGVGRASSRRRGRTPAVDDPCRQGARVQGRRRRGRGPREAARVRHPRAVRWSLRLQGRSSGDGDACQHHVVPGRQGPPQHAGGRSGSASTTSR